MSGIYVASKSRHGQMWRDLRGDGLPICSTWIDESDGGATADWGDLWSRCVAEASSADALLALHVDGEEWKGAFVEIGAALAAGRPVFVVGKPPGSWVHHPLVTLVPDLGQAFLAIESVVRKVADP